LKNEVVQDKNVIPTPQEVQIIIGNQVKKFSTFVPKPFVPKV
jgi:hypothetical protein